MVAFAVRQAFPTLPLQGVQRKVHQVEAPVAGARILMSRAGEYKPRTAGVKRQEFQLVLCFRQCLLRDIGLVRWKISLPNCAKCSGACVMA